MLLRCRECDGETTDALAYACPACGGRLKAICEPTLDKGRISANHTLVERYPDALPSKGSLLGSEGNTPLRAAENLRSSLGTAATVYLKDERRNPTNSFKDRALGPTMSLAAENGVDAVITASTGNGAAACAHYAARGGLDCYLLLDEKTPREKIIEPLLYGADALRVRNLFTIGSESFRELLVKVADRLGAYLAVANQVFTPLPIQGVKSISYEVVQQLNWEVPDVVVTPVGGGDNLIAQYDGYRDMREAGLVESIPRMVGVQAEGSAPLVAALDQNDPASVYIDPDTIASGINVPFTTQEAVDAVRKSGGTALSVNDDAITEGERMLAATEAVWAEPASAVLVPALEKLSEKAIIQSDDTVVLTVTGAGHKNVKPIQETLSPLGSTSLDAEAIATALQ